MEIKKAKTKKAGKKLKTLVLLDSHAIIHRAFHALPALTNQRGEPTGAVYGFTTILLRILAELKPDYIAAAFDLPGPTFRHAAFERYKAQRPATPNELASQFENVRRLTRAFGIPVLEKESFEADDVIGTIAARIAKKTKDVQVVIVTGDLDTLQLVNDRISVYTMRKGVTDTVMYDAGAVFERYGLKPAQLADFKGLRGDPSDNIPGVKGIGEKTAADLLKRFGSIEKLYRGLKKAKISPAVKEKLEREREEARFSKMLATINCGVPIDFDLDAARWEGLDGRKEIEALLTEFGFGSLLRRLGYLKHEKAAHAAEQSGLFGAGAKEAEIPAWDSAGGNPGPLALFPEERAAIIATPAGLFQISAPETKRGVVKKLLDAKNEKTYFDEKYFLKLAGKFEAAPADFDILIALYLLRPGERSYTVERAAKEAGIAAARYQAYKSGFQIRARLEAKLKERNLWRVFAEIEMPLVPILAEIEARGMRLDAAYLRRLSQKTEQSLKKNEREAYALAGKEFNLNSPKQVSEILFTTLGLGERGIRKTGGGALSTNAREMAKLASLHPVVGKILEYRELAKLQGTYINALPQLADMEGLIHTTLNQTLTSTGRLSSSDPNLQNIPTRTDFGREIRKAFIPRDGYFLVSFDYSQIELRVAAAMSGDEKMKTAFTEGKDIHALTAMEVNNLKTLAEVTPAMRYAAKALNFGVLYGMGARAFAESAGIEYDEAKRFMEEYAHDFPRIKEFMAETLAKARRLGYVETMLGRRRYIPEINSANWRERAEAERMAMNAPIQGTATGDIVKLAMIEVNRFLKNDASGAGHILMQVHDEILCEIKEKEVRRIAPAIKKTMERIYDIGIPLVVDVKAGKNWGEMGKLVAGN